MRTTTRWQAMVLAAALAAMPRLAAAYPNGTGEYVSDAGPFCAGCAHAVQTIHLLDVACPPKSAKRHKHQADGRRVDAVDPHLRIGQHFKQSLEYFRGFTRRLR